MMIFFAAMMTWTLIEARRRGGPWRWSAYAIVCALGVWSHFVTAFVPIGHGAWLAWRAIRHREWRSVISGFTALIAAAVITITLYSPMIPQMLDARGMFSATQIDQPTILSPEGWHALLQLGGSWCWWAAIPGLALFTVGLFAILGKTSETSDAGAPSREGANIVVELAMLGLPLMLIVVALSGTWMYARFTLFALPGAMLLIALGLDAIWRWRIVAGAIAMAIVSGVSTADLSIRPPKQPLRNAADYVRAHRAPNDRTLVVGLAHEVLRIYDGDLKLSYSFHHGADLMERLARIHPQWIVVEYPRSVSPETYDLIKHAGFSEVAHFHGWADWNNGDIVVYRRD
jgi:4-amino-4-deoxy-L-arabinose transferase-like glycosyltransferase